MRVVGGTARGRKLTGPEGMDVRPTTDKVKESVFNIIQFEVPGSDMLDLFAGSGQMGIEALSRGAENAVFVDSSRKSLNVVKSNIDTVGFNDRAKLVMSDSIAFLGRTDEKFDIVFLDPPYHCGLIDKAFEYLPRVLKDTSVVVCETKADEELPESFGDFEIKKTYKYSAIKITLYRSK